ncbi:MAG: FAD-dependent oxidoreductase [Magnetococcales bacterium]|nr:FAD-dependent oxidoreductase [Magnetococcales bacterium]
MSAVKKSVAIIGGGISGLATAFYLKKMGYTFKIFEPMHHLGGNARTKSLDICGEKRWYEIGVNDFNANTYTNLVSVFKELGVKSEPLWDTSAYANILKEDGSKKVAQSGYTIDATRDWGNSASADILAGDALFHKKASEFLENIHIYKDMTMEQFVAWAGLKEDFVNNNLYPRIIGMFYTNGVPPAELPMRMIISYYLLQEGVGQGQSLSHVDRRYFVGGVTTWIDTLSDFLIDGAQEQLVFTHTTATFIINSNKTFDVTYKVKKDPPTTQTFDAVVIAMHAKDVAATFGNYKQDIPSELQNIFPRFRYSTNDVVIHSDSSLMPPDNNAWRTYNINIPTDLNYTNPENLKYFITYYANQHQNTRKNPDYNCQNTTFNNLCVEPHYFITVNDRGKVSDGAKIAPNPKNNTGCPGMYRFYHNIFDTDAMLAQGQLVKYQGVNNIHFVGGYTKGSGLHEECWLSGWAAAKKIADPSFKDPNVYDFTKKGVAALPLYMRNMISDHYSDKYPHFARHKLATEE